MELDVAFDPGDEGQPRVSLLDLPEEIQLKILHLLQPLFQVVKEGVLRLKHLLDRGLVLGVSLREVCVDLSGEADSVVHLQLHLHICNQGRDQLKKNVFFRALPELPRPPPPTDPNLGNLVLFFQTSKFIEFAKMWGGGGEIY